MKGLNKVALVAAIAAASTAQAELVAMDDAAMSAATGQAGLTIDINSATLDIGQIAYQDQGFLNINGLSLSGAGTNNLDDIRMTVDVAGDASNLDLGMPALGSSYLTAGGATVANLTETLPTIGDGDLVITLRSQSGLPIDYGLSIGDVQLAESGYASEIGGPASGTTTTLLSAATFEGNLGPIDIVIHNDGGTANTMEISAFFNVSDMGNGKGTLTLPFMNTHIGGFSLHNLRGPSVVAAGTTQDLTFAHAQMIIGQSANGLALNLVDFSGDMDIEGISLNGAGGTSIGNLYITDLKVSANMEVYGH
ncbi:MAG: hypothetical protein CSA52_00385 [Gammaproteobacteria bacterium]|nr:MAG: hypothetical protein CSB48_12400 [Pseudomonadota bacterium]PIE38939.1 MAG: hypothetical protein CSA52_00385 [Gammaproteobacteria bacterium]